ncbi:nucleoid-structuring protein H-NS [Pseudomonas sp. ANT_H14]|nr:nucleoid-structuring protein H-NS [Pseudomonas sp. ANT_H14]
MGADQLWEQRLGWVHIRCCGNGGLGLRPYGPARLNRRPAGLPTDQYLRSAIVVNGAP